MNNLPVNAFDGIVYIFVPEKYTEYIDSVEQCSCCVI